MGYNTRYKLTVQLLIGSKIAQLADDAPLFSLIAELREENEEARYCLDEKGEAEDSGKWYEHEADFRAFSLKHPTILFTLHGEGEENDDIWNKYFLNGKCQVAKAEFQIAPFDRKKLA